MNAASPEDFDKLYLNQQQAAQKTELPLLQGYADTGESADIKPAAAKAAAKVQAHLAKVQAHLAKVQAHLAKVQAHLAKVKELNAALP